MKTFVIALCVLSSAALAANPKPTGTPQPAKPAPVAPEGLSASVHALLSGYEYVPSKSDWDRLGPAAFDELAKIWKDSAQKPTTRSRAVSSLALVTSPGAEPLLKSILQDVSIDAKYRSVAAMALSVRLGDQSVPVLKPLLDDKEPRLRESAARALAQTHAAVVPELLKTRLAKEQNATVRDALETSLSRVTAR